MSAAPGPSARQVLEPCPFCGITPAFVHEVDYCTPSEWTVLCLNSECGVSHATEAEAITAWNRRATDPAVAELVEALNAILTDMPIIDCDRLHHTKEDRHGAGPCPVEMRLDAAVSRASALLAKYAASPRDAT